MIFISHANEPADNEFTRWLALRLAAIGYPVWCDITKLLGGEKSWDNIEQAIRLSTEKVLVVLSRNSNERDAVLKEVTLAARVGKTRNDFIIPLRIDDLPNDDVTIELARLNTINFADGWASGLARLIEKFEKDGICKCPEIFNPNAVATWWKDHQRAIGEVHADTETCASNWFAISNLPEQIFSHSIDLSRESVRSTVTKLKVPIFQEKGRVFSFEDENGITKEVTTSKLEFLQTTAVKTADFWKYGDSRLRIAKAESRNIMTSLLQQAFAIHLENAGLKRYALSGNKACFWFQSGFTDGDKIYFEIPYPENTKRTRNRMLVGKKLRMNGEPTKRRWHFAIQPKLIRWPRMCFAIQPHVIFTDANGMLLSKERQHTARRSACRSWHNDKWIDMILASMHFLKSGETETLIKVQGCNQSYFNVSSIPLTFGSPVSYGIVKGLGDSSSVDSDSDDSEDPDVDDDESEDVILDETH